MPWSQLCVSLILGPSSSHGCRVFSLFLWRRRPILYFTRRNIDDEFGELRGITGAFFHFKNCNSAPTGKRYLSQQSQLKLPTPMAEARR
jgi:hypothetical protein